LYGNTSPLAGDTFRMVGGLFFNQGMVDSAIVYTEKTLGNYREFYGEEHIKVADMYSLLGNHKSEAGDHTAGLEYQYQALSIFRNTFPGEDVRFLEIYFRVGQIYYRMKNHSQASDHFNKAIALSEESGIVSKAWLAEMYNLDLDADLIVLSSCDSGIGKLVKGEGVISMTRGLFYSGAANIIVSLWKVTDHHTSTLMIELYRHILEGKTYSEALRAAKLHMIKDQSTAAPLFWSGFILIGT
jgi:tetratricopeptide (TPR) repeat protein